jgi:type IV pilus assembly protein PilV
MALMECLVAMLIFSVGILGLLGLEAKAINFSVDAEDRNRASVLANEIASNMWLNNTVNVTTLPAVVALIAGANDPTRTGLSNGTVAINPVAGTTNAADIVVSWKPPSDLATDPTSVLSTRVILP